MLTRGTEVNLLKNKYPGIYKQLDPDKNLNINIDKLSFSSHKIVSWICTKNTNHKYNACPNNRTKFNGTNCDICFRDTLRVHDETGLINHRNNFISNISKIKTGDETEKYVCEMLESMNYYKDIINLGNIGATADIKIIKNNDKTYYVQVKTLSHINKNAYYLTHTVGKYPENMLIIMVNKERNRFALEFAGNITTKKLYLSFGSKRTKQIGIMYTDINKFKRKLKKLIVYSRRKLEFSNKLYKKEYNMLRRFELFCIQNDIIYQRNPTNSEPWDGVINGYKFQSKYVSLNYGDKLTYNISSDKCAGTLNKKQITQNYDVGDFDYIIVEVGGTKIDKSKYKNNFCIIPSEILIEQKILKSDTCKGKKGFCICPPDYTRIHWSKTFWNHIPNELKILKETKI